MKNLLHLESEENSSIYLPALFNHMGFQLVKAESNYMLYEQSKRHYVVLNTEQGYRYYNVRRPQEKMKASDLIREHVSRVEGKSNTSIWDKMANCYGEISELKTIKEASQKNPPLEKVALDFNHFHGYVTSTKLEGEGLYAAISKSEKFKNRIASSTEGKPLFPLYNLQNEVCGYFVDDSNNMTALGESAIRNSIWYSEIPKTIEWLIIFNNPKEAIAFDKKFKLKNVVYLALGDINYNTTKILFQIHKLTKVKKMVLTFTGSKKIEGYLRDLNFISYMDDSNFMMTVNEKDITVRFALSDEKAFLRFYKGTKNFNQGLTQSFKKYSKVPDQHLINQYSILVSKDDTGIKVRIPLEVNAIKFFVWCYYKNYLNKTLDILKPKYPNWYVEYEATQSIQIKGKEEQIEEYRIAL